MESLVPSMLSEIDIICDGLRLTSDECWTVRLWVSATCFHQLVFITMILITTIQFKNNAPLLGIDPFKAPFPISVLRAHADMGRNAVKLISKLEQSTHGFAT